MLLQLYLQGLCALLSFTTVITLLMPPTTYSTVATPRLWHLTTFQLVYQPLLPLCVFQTEHYPKTPHFYSLQSLTFSTLWEAVTKGGVDSMDHGLRILLNSTMNTSGISLKSNGHNVNGRVLSNTKIPVENS